ncbi:DUF3987 domain-containing protein [Lutibacter citreus]|uniref:DUF3987 domain-containing protein n=1 Tax=Lutibacter citreus TaxID=2138210 RepID=UPI0013006D27|nr:DUF3987 domain-containing protein [Lutibacter citreus]
MVANNSNPFPYEVFPTEIMIFLEQAEKTLNFPIDFLGSSILSACSVAIGNTYKVKIKEGFYTKANLYMVIVGNAGEVKSHPLSLAYAPIEKKEKESYLNYKKEIEEYDSLNDDEKKISLKPFWKKQIVKDFTPESLIKIHSNNSRGVSILSDELFGWIKNFGRYNSSSEQETYLSFWNGGSISVDRKSDEPIRLDNTYVNIIGTVQTKLLSELTKNNRGDNGFIDRFLFAFNQNPKPVLWNNENINKESIEYYNFLIQRLFSLEFNNFNSNIICFSPEANELLIKWQNQSRRDCFNDPIKTGILAKYEVYVARFSLIIQLMHWALNNKSNNKIELFAVENAIKLIEYYTVNAIIINNKINNINPLEELTINKKELYNSLDSNFTTVQALKQAAFYKINERALFRFLKNRTLFKKEKQGLYSKQLII